MDFQRARKSDQIEERKQEILMIARELCREHGVMKWSFNELGRRASITKSNLYRYFGSREEVLMQLLTDEMESFTWSFNDEIEEKPYDIGEFSKILAARYAGSSFFCELLSVGPTILEHNVDIDPIIKIKRRGLGLIMPNAGIFIRAFNWITEEDAVRVSQAIAVYAAGLWPLANPASVMEEVTKREEFQCIKFDFEEKMTEFIATILWGCRNSKLGKQPGQ